MKSEEYYIETFDKFIEAFGEDAEIDMCIEEMSELTKELCKYRRYQREKSANSIEKIEKTKQNIVEECADVLICAKQIKHIFGSDAVERMMDYKIERGRNIVESRLRETSGKKADRSKK